MHLKIQTRVQNKLTIATVKLYSITGPQSRVTVGYGGVMGMTERGGYENPTYLSWLRFKDIPSCSTSPFVQQ